MELTKQKISRLDNFKAEFTERQIRSYYRNKDWKVLKIIRFGEKQDPLLFKDLEGFKHREKIMREFRIAREVMKKHKYDMSYPDFVCEKGDKLKFVEVKSSIKKLKKSKVKQKYIINHLYHKGYEVELIHVSMSEERAAKIKEIVFKDFTEKDIATKLSEDVKIVRNIKETPNHEKLIQVHARDIKIMRYKKNSPKPKSFEFTHYKDKLKKKVTNP